MRELKCVCVCVSLSLSVTWPTIGSPGTYKAYMYVPSYDLLVHIRPYIYAQSLRSSTYKANQTYIKPPPHTNTHAQTHTQLYTEHDIECVLSSYRMCSLFLQNVCSLTKECTQSIISERELQAERDNISSTRAQLISNVQQQWDLKAAAIEVCGNLNPKS